MTTKVQIVVGLGNPGSRYDRTRHNAGFWWVERLAQMLGGQFRANNRFQGEVAEVRSASGPLRLLKPTTFMNHSGRAVGALAGFYRVPGSEVLVVHDEIDLPPGTARLKRGGGDGGHRGLRDIIPVIGGGFLRLRIGVGRPEHSEEVISYVLKRAGSDDQGLIDDSIERSLGLAEDIFAGDDKGVMNVLNRKSSTDTTKAAPSVSKLEQDEPDSSGRRRA